MGLTEDDFAPLNIDNIDKLFDDEDDKNEVSTLNKKEFVKAEKVND